MKRLIEKGYYKRYTYEIYKRLEHYELYIDGEFWASGDSFREVEEELENI